MHFRSKPYVPAGTRRQTTGQLVARMQKAGHALAPVTASRGAIANSFWGKAWCQNLERYSDFSSRLPRGRTYLRNGAVIDLQIGPGEVNAQVMGSDLYQVSVRIDAVDGAQWQALAHDCARSIDTLVELLQGRLSTSVMERITRPETGLFPSPREISFNCSCPDSAAMCKHIAAALYGIGARLDAEPELFFRLRRVDAQDLIARAGQAEAPLQGPVRAGRILTSAKLADLFGIDFGSFEAKKTHKRAPVRAKPAKRAPTSKPRGKVKKSRAR